MSKSQETRLQIQTQNRNTLRTELEKMKDQLEAAIPRQFDADRFSRVAMTAIQRDPKSKLLECTPISIIAGIVEATQLGLELDGIRGHAYLVPFWNSDAGCYQAQFIPGYKGLAELAYRSGKVELIEQQIVREGDEFEFCYGTNGFVRHVPSENAEPGKWRAAYAVVHMASGLKSFRVMWRSDIMQIRDRSPAKIKKGDRAGQIVGPWKTDEEAMAMKTVTRQECKLLPSSPQLQRAIGLDELHDANLAQNLAALHQLVGGATTKPQAALPPSTLDGLTAKLQGQNGDPVASPEEIVAQAIENMNASNGVRDIQSIAGNALALVDETFHGEINKARDARLEEIRSKRGKGSNKSDEPEQPEEPEELTGMARFYAMLDACKTPTDFTDFDHLIRNTKELNDEQFLELEGKMSNLKADRLGETTQQPD